MSNKRRDFFIRMIANVGIYLKKQRNITRKGDYATGIDDAQFALVVLFTASCLLIATTLIVILWLIWWDEDIKEDMWRRVCLMIIKSSRWLVYYRQHLLWLVWCLLWHIWQIISVMMHNLLMCRTVIKRTEACYSPGSYFMYYRHLLYYRWTVITRSYQACFWWIACKGNAILRSISVFCLKSYGVMP